MPFADTHAMQAHLDEIHLRGQGAHAVLLLKRARWYTTDKLAVPKSISLVFLPSRAPELNPVENIWQYVRGNWLSNRVFKIYGHVLDVACDAWKGFIAQPSVVSSIGTRKWAYIDQA